MSDIRHSATLLDSKLLLSQALSCTYPDCGKVFSKAFELRKHKIAHEHPDRVFHCPECDFITLQKKNLAIHIAIHTGEKIHRCSDMVSVVDSSRLTPHEERCEYRTNDPAALTKHRKRAHGYIPPPNRSWPRRCTPAAPHKPRKNDGKVSRCHCPPPYQPPLPVSCPEPSRVLEKINTCSGGSGYASTSTASQEYFAPSLQQGDLDVYGEFMTLCSSNLSTRGSSISSSAALVTQEEAAIPVEEMDLNNLYDPSLQPQWMAKYEMSYSMFDMTSMKYLPELLPAAPPSYMVGLDARTGREGCLCPEWMVEAGIEGWDQSALDVHRQFYA